MILQRRILLPAVLLLVVVLGASFALLFRAERVYRQVYPPYLLAKKTVYEKLDIQNRYDIHGAAVFFHEMNPGHPGLEKVSAALKAGDYETAVKEYLHWREAGAGRPRFFDLKKIAGKNPPDIRPEGYITRLSKSVDIAERYLRDEFIYGNQVYRLSVPPSYFPQDPLEDILVNSFEFISKNLGIAFLLGQDVRYPDKFAYFFNAWCDAASPLPDPYVEGDITHPQAYYLFTVARRAHSWAYAYYLFNKSLSDETRFRLAREILSHVKYVNASMEAAINGAGSRKNHEFWFQKGNQPLITAANQAGVLIMFPEFDKGSRMLSNSMRIIDSYLKNNLTAEGHQPERDEAYHEGSLVYLSELFLLARLNGVPIDPSIERDYEKTFEVLARIMQPNGYLPAVGNAYLATDPSNYLALGAYIFNRPDLKAGSKPNFTSPGVDFDAYAFFLDYLTDGATPARKSYLESDALPSTGFYVMRSGGGVSGAGKDGDPYDESLYLFFDLAPSMGHTHYDAMNIIISGYGSKPPYNLLDESGISHDWNVNPRTPQYFSPRAHNVVVIDGKPTPSWEDDPPPVLRKWVSNRFIDFASGSYGKKYEGNDLNRDILFVKGEYWILRDTIQGHGTHAIEQVFNFSPVVNEMGDRRERKYDFEIDPVSKAFHTNYKGPNLLLVPAVPDKVEVNLLDGWKWHEDLSDPNPAREAFLDVRSPTLSYSTRADTSVPFTFETILYPLHKQERRRIIVEKLDKGAPLGRETGLKILINESNLRGRRKEKREAKADYFLTGSDSKESIIGPGIRFIGWHGIVRTNSAGVFLMCVVDGKKLEYHGLGMESERSADICIDSTRPGVYEVETTDAVSLSLPLVNKGNQPGVKMKTVFSGGWVEADFKIDEAGREVSVFIPSPGKYVIKVTEQKSIK